MSMEPWQGQTYCFHQACASFKELFRGMGLSVQFAVFIGYMIKLCFHGSNAGKDQNEISASRARSMSLGGEFKALKRMMPIGVVMPVQRALTVALPADGVPTQGYNPFPTGQCATICGIADGVEILQSLQRPKKVCTLACQLPPNANFCSMLSESANLRRP